MCLQGTVLIAVRKYDFFIPSPKHAETHFCLYTGFCVASLLVIVAVAGLGMISGVTVVIVVAVIIALF